MKITLFNKPLREYKIILRKNAGKPENFAANELREYLYKMTGESLDIAHGGKNGLYLYVQPKEDRFDDGFIIAPYANGLKFSARNGRGIIYAVYDFIERMGYRFFSAEFAGKGFERGEYMSGEETLFDDTDKTIGADFYVSETPALYYRDGFTYACSRNRDFLKFRLNAESWGLHNFDEEWGGGHRFCGEAGHSFAVLVPSRTYYDSHPEFFAEIDGKRVKNESGHFLAEPQLCLTNPDLVPFVAEKMLAMLRKNYADFISLSQSDSAIFCQCPSCRESYKKYGYFGTLLRFVNRAAKIVGKEFPKVKIHTYCYEKTADANLKTRAAKNVLVQYCPRVCHRHALDDPRCLPNVKILEKLKTVGRICDNFFIYDYRACLSYAMLMLPDIRYLRDNMRCYADAGVKGIYAELNIFSTTQPTMEELRLYLFAKLCWNPYMSEAEYNRHIDEFLQGFYGAGWRKIREFIEFYQDEAIGYHLDSFNATMMNDKGEFVRNPDGNLFQGLIFPKKDERRILDTLNRLLDEAQAGSGGKNAKYYERIDIIRTGLLWYDLFANMDAILENGTEEEKAEVIARNELLCVKMRRYWMKYTTFIGMKPTTDMFENYSLSPAKWNYTVDNQCSGEAFNHDTVQRSYV